MEQIVSKVSLQKLEYSHYILGLFHWKKKNLK